MTKALRRYQVRVSTTRGSWQMLTSAKSTRQAINNARWRLRERGIFAEISDCTVEEVA